MKRSTLKWVVIVAFINASICAVLVGPAAVSAFRSAMEVLDPLTIDDFRRDGDLYWNDVTSEKTPIEVAGRYVYRVIVAAARSGFEETIHLHEDGTYEYDDVSIPLDARRVHKTGKWRMERDEESKTVSIDLNEDDAAAVAKEEGREVSSMRLNLEESAAGLRLRWWNDADTRAYYTRDSK